LEQEALINGLKNADPECYRLLVATYHGQVYQVCMGFICHVEDAEDLTQEVFVEVFRSISNFRGEAKIGTWLHRIAVTKSLELIRSRKRKKRAAELLSLVGLGKLGLEPAADRFDHPGVALENLEKAKALQKAIDRLPDQQRTAFVLHKVDEKSYQETAEIMGLSESAIDSLVFRARSNLKKFLGENFLQQH
jgi:RNA polymerase sigma factor (sigma-70 family)